MGESWTRFDDCMLIWCAAMLLVMIVVQFWGWALVYAVLLVVGVVLRSVASNREVQ